MCGIAGIYSFRKEPGIDLAVLRSMRDRLVHRGPDGAGEWISSDGRIVLAHRRLSIVDLSTQASQPMCNEDGAIWVVFNGEIYNHLDLRRELKQAGHRFKTDHSDTETIIHGYEQWGDGVWSRLKGMFGVGLYDAKDFSLTLVRDRVGVKPVYFTSQKQLFIFASEIKAILAHPEIDRDVSLSAMYHYLSFMTTPAPLTMFQDIFKLPAGHILKISKTGEMRCQRYWDALPGKGIKAEEVRGLSETALEDFFVKGIRARLTRSVEKRMMSDVPIGVFLSGGIDSSTIVALMNSFMNRPVDSFTVGFKDHHHLNELYFAENVARLYKTNHHVVMVDERDMSSYLDALIHTQDEPIADWVCIPLYFVSRLAREQGVKVVQVGEGADEQFCGYDSYLQSLSYYHGFWRRFRTLLPSFGQKAAASAAKALAPFGTRHAIRADTFDRAARDRELFWSGAYVFGEVQKKKLLHPPYTNRFTAAQALLIQCGMLPEPYLSPDSYEIIRSFRQSFPQVLRDKDILNQMIYYEFKMRLPELLLMRVDKITMSVSLEARVPFLDHELVEFSMDIPMEWKIRRGQTKYLLKKAVQGLIPDEIISRPKMGFGAPMCQWMRGQFGRQVESTLLSSRLLERGHFRRSFIKALLQRHQEGIEDTSVYLWTLFNLAAWYDYWIDQKTSE